MAEETGGERGGRLGLGPLSFPVLCGMAGGQATRLARPLWRTSWTCYAPLGLVCGVLAVVLRDDRCRSVGVFFAYLLLAALAAFCCQVQTARIVARDVRGEVDAADDCGWWLRHGPGVAESAVALFVSLCGIYTALLIVFSILAMLIGEDASDWLVFVFLYAYWAADLLFRVLAIYVPAVAGLGLASGWEAVGCSLRLMRRTIREVPEIVPLSLGGEMVVMRVATMIAGLFDTYAMVAFVLLHALLWTCVRPALSVLQPLVLIDALGRETPFDEDGLTALLAGAGEPQ